MIFLECTNCRKQLRVGDEFAGKRGKCPFCGTEMLIPHLAKPAPSAQVGSATEMITASILEEAKAAATPQTPSSRIRFYCPMCARAVTSQRQHVGMRVTCPHCNRSITVPDVGL